MFRLTAKQARLHPWLRDSEGNPLLPIEDGDGKPLASFSSAVFGNGSSGESGSAEQTRVLPGLNKMQRLREVKSAMSLDTSARGMSVLMSSGFSAGVGAHRQPGDEDEYEYGEYDEGEGADATVMTPLNMSTQSQQRRLSYEIGEDMGMGLGLGLGLSIDELQSMNPIIGEMLAEEAFQQVYIRNLFYVSVKCIEKLYLHPADVARAASSAASAIVFIYIIYIVFLCSMLLTVCGCR